MSALGAERRAHEAATFTRSLSGQVGRQVAIGYLVLLIVTPGATAIVQWATEEKDAGSSGPVSRVVDVRCSGGHLVAGIDTGRADGALLAKSLPESC
ncbi:hypothetical protein [Kineosporia sp. NBRC 101731]|uniref:hypothetical protein n=1 Tax=Kineosporia sp. NBRC 101731 TaxID=3032199 RepID=UPI0024A2E745|nr:hypothetical protein [Kineosporia sp. NBRC 101731]GLY32422.1 hypothetical protein Kisp02_57870 [Kineosporia sp. NBRC 101731]